MPPFQTQIKFRKQKSENISQEKNYQTYTLETEKDFFFLNPKKKIFKTHHLLFL